MGTERSRLQTVDEVAARLGVTPRTLRAWIAAGRIVAVRLSVRCLRIEEGEVERFLAERRVGGRP